MNEIRKREFFQTTLDLASKGWGTTHPNPMVGALIVRDQEILARGYHEKAGGAHAEVAALEQLDGVSAKGADMFVSLEPCSTTGRTPPCTQAILDAGIRKVFIGTTDPNPAHAGKGLDLLREAGVDVELAEPDIRMQADRLNFIFNHNQNTDCPLIALKLAESANGMVSASRGKPTRVTEEDARNDVMRWRRLFPAICVGSGTVLADDPSLTARLPEETFCPVRLVFDSTLSTLADTIPDRKIYSDEFSSRTHILTTSQGMNHADSVDRARNLGVSIREMPTDKNGHIELSSIHSVLREVDVNSLYCEGGPTLAQSFLDLGLVDYLFRYRSPKIFDGPDAMPAPDLDSLTIHDSLTQSLGEDHLEHGFL